MRRPATDGLDGAHARPTELVHYEVADRIATITLDSPHNRNALSRQLVTELFERLDRADQDDDVGGGAPAVGPGVLLRRRPHRGVDHADGGGCAGDGRAAADDRGAGQAGRDPAVGAARAGGIGIVAASDIVLAAEDATFALTEVKLGLAPAVISLTVLPRLTQRAAALTASSGEVFTGAEAVGYGLVTRAVPADQLDAAVPPAA